MAAFVFAGVVFWLEMLLLCGRAFDLKKHRRHGNVPRCVCISGCAVMRGEIFGQRGGKAGI